MQSIDMNGETTFKLTDLGVARQMNPDELSSPSIPGTEEFVHPIVYRLEICTSLIISHSISYFFSHVFSDKKNSRNRTPTQFPFEVEMWSFGVTLYQCATGSNSLFEKKEFLIDLYRTNSISTI